MATISDKMWMDYSEAFGYIGNSLMAPMSETSQTGLDPQLWLSFPDFKSNDVRTAMKPIADYSAAQTEAERRGDDIVAIESAEWADLFFGESAKAAPYESVYVGNDAVVNEMRAHLAEAGLELPEEILAHADSMGLEVLYLSILCARMAGNMMDEKAPIPTSLQIHAFVKDHPLAWVSALRDAVAAAAPNGYFEKLLLLEEAILANLKVHIEA